MAVAAYQKPSNSGGISPTIAEVAVSLMPPTTPALQLGAAGAGYIPLMMWMGGGGSGGPATHGYAIG
jgi:hypothetical protein